ncbi:PREDICTED: interferon gamma receptor 1 isoform X1 [Sturnus vulgaris]|uniref:interferon gamma receptor 1 isoform X1 n=1 Tax=Sturnus vulgaris TaxID=9172 RepID=UPI00071A359B|nr:PREDICTED: interferon gamma receptor 1 isoform X1 [Sturnus vulgaris]
MWPPLSLSLSLLALAALLAPRWGAASQGEQPPAVPSPTEIVVTSENFRTVLHWQYPPVPETPRFIVEIKPYNPGEYKNVSTCVNTSAHFCDVSEEICDPYISYWFQVKAVVGSQQSEYVEANEFILQRHGKIGPPKLNLSRHGDKILVDIYHPLFPLSCIEDIYSKLQYLVNVRDSKNETEELYEDNCTMHKCSLKIPVPTESSTYCVSAKGIFEDLMVGTPSDESCTSVLFNQALSTHLIIILCVVIGILTVIPTVYCGCKKLRKNNIQLPKSLVNVMRNLNTGALLVPKSEGKYFCVPSGHSELPVNGEVTLLEIEPEEQTVSPVNSCDGESSVPSPEVAPAKAEEVPVQESTEEVSVDADEQNCKVKESYFISEGSQMDICSTSSGSEISTVETQRTVIPSTCFKFSGYDKPHVPLDVLMIDVGEEQPVNAYRPTE